MLHREGVPIFVLTTAGRYPERLSAKEQELFRLQQLGMAGECSKAIEGAKTLLESTTDSKICLGCWLTIAYLEIFHGDLQLWKTAVEQIKEYKSGDATDRMSLELMIFLTENMGGTAGNPPKWFLEGDLEGLPEELYPLMRLLTFTLNLFSGVKNVVGEERCYEILCAQAEADGIPMLTIYWHMYLALYYLCTRNPQKVRKHLERGVDLAIEHKIYIPIAAVWSSVNWLLVNMLADREPKVVKLISQMAEQYNQMIAELYEAYMGQAYPLRNLNPKETQIVTYLVMGMSNKEIGEMSFLSPETVKKYLTSVYQKTGVRGRKELIERLDVHRYGRG